MPRYSSGRCPPRALAALFGEGSGGFVVSGPGAALDALAERVPVRRLGAVAGGSLVLAAPAGAEEGTIAVPLEVLRRTHASLEELFS